MTSDRLQRFRDRLGLPLIAAPMFLVSGVELMVAACRNGVIGSFPTVNCRSTEQLESWLSEIDMRLRQHEDQSGRKPAPLCPNLIVHRSNARLEQDLAVLLRHRPEIVITSVGSPAPVLKPLHDAGALVLADVASIRHAERAAAAGADGLVLLTAGRRRADRLAQSVCLRPRGACVLRRNHRARGRHQRWPRAARRRSARLRSRLHGHEVHRHAREHGGRASQADAGRQQCRRHPADHRIHGPADQHAEAVDRGCGLDPDDLPARGAIDIGKDIDVAARESRPKRWRDIWSGGHSASGVTDVLAVDDLVARTLAEYREAGGR